MRLCNKCGATVSEVARFCEICGEKLTDIVEQPKTPGGTETDSNKIEELDLTALDKKAANNLIQDAQDQKKENLPREQKPDTTPTQAPSATAPNQQPQADKNSQNRNIIDLKDILESDEKVEMDNTIKREALADDEVLSKICPMCGEDMQLNKNLLENTPVMVKCLKCGNETKIW